MRVAIADVDPDAVDSVTKEFDGRSDVLIQSTDVRSADSVRGLADAVYERFGACHLLCNNAGVGAPSSKVWRTTPNDWAWIFSVNVTGVVNGILTFLPRMIDSGEEGYVVNTSSGDGPIAPMPSASVYAASKAAVSVLTECLAAELSEDGIPIGASVFYPSGGLLRTGLWTSDRTRPAEFARELPARDRTNDTGEARSYGQPGWAGDPVAAARRAGRACDRRRARRALRDHEGFRRCGQHAALPSGCIRRRTTPEFSRPSGVTRSAGRSPGREEAESPYLGDHPSAATPSTHGGGRRGRCSPSASRGRPGDRRRRIDPEPCQDRGGDSRPFLVGMRAQNSEVPVRLGRVHLCQLV